MEWVDRDLHIVLDDNRCESCKELDQKVIFDSNVINYLPKATKLLNILVVAELFKSKGDARGNWKYGFELEEGFSFGKYEGLGKLRKNLYILNVPSSYKHGECDKDDSAS